MSRQTLEELARIRMLRNAGIIDGVKELTSEEVAAQVEEYLRKGKQITQIPIGVSGVSQPQLSKSQREKQCGVKKL